MTNDLKQRILASMKEEGFTGSINEYMLSIAVEQSKPPAECVAERKREEGYDTNYDIPSKFGIIVPKPFEIEERTLIDIAPLDEATEMLQQGKKVRVRPEHMDCN